MNSINLYLFKITYFKVNLIIYFILKDYFITNLTFILEIIVISK